MMYCTWCLWCLVLYHMLRCDILSASRWSDDDVTHFIDLYEIRTIHSCFFFCFLRFLQNFRYYSVHASLGHVALAFGAIWWG
jgi:hypothetical protein